MEAIVEQKLYDETNELANFLDELTMEEKQEFMSFIEGIRFMKKLSNGSV